MIDLNVRISVTNEGPGMEAKLKAIKGLNEVRLDMSYVFTATLTGEEWNQIDSILEAVKKTPDIAVVRFDPFTPDISQHLVENELKKLGVTASEFTNDMGDQTKKMAYHIVSAKVEPSTVKRYKVYTSGLIEWMP
jgi:hypothetical protein